MPSSIFASIATVNSATTVSSARGWTSASVCRSSRRRSSGAPLARNGSQMCFIQTSSNSSAIASACSLISAVASRVSLSDSPSSCRASPTRATPGARDLVAGPAPPWDRPRLPRPPELGGVDGPPPPAQLGEVHDRRLLLAERSPEGAGEAHDVVSVAIARLEHAADQVQGEALLVEPLYALHPGHYRLVVVAHPPMELRRWQQAEGPPLAQV